MGEGLENTHLLAAAPPLAFPPFFAIRVLGYCDIELRKLF